MKTVTLKIPKREADELQEFLDGPGQDQVGAEAMYTVRLNDLFEADIKVCRGDPPYVDAVLFRRGHEVMCLDGADTLLGEYEFSGWGFKVIVEVNKEEALEERGD